MIFVANSARVSIFTVGLQKTNRVGEISFFFELPDTRHDVAIALLSRPGAQQPRPPLADTAEAEDRRARVSGRARCFGAPSV